MITDLYKDIILYYVENPEIEKYKNVGRYTAKCLEKLYAK